MGAAWDYAVANMRGDRPRVIVEEFIAFDSEITLLTVATKDGVLFCEPIGHRQEKGDYRESWQPADMPAETLRSAQDQARKVVEALGGHGIFGVEFFIAGGRAIFSELSPRPHDTGMVTLISQSPNQFELHLRAILGLPIPSIDLAGPAASAVILADRESSDFGFEGVGGCAGPGRAGRTGRRAHLRQAQHAQESPHGRGAGSGGNGGGRQGQSGCRQQAMSAFFMHRLIFFLTLYVCFRPIPAISVASDFRPIADIGASLWNESGQPMSVRCCRSRA